MKYRFLSSITAAFVAFAPLPAIAAQPAPAPEAAEARPALWRVADEDTTIYLFGTFHLMDQRSWFGEGIRAAFDRSDELVVEAIVPEDPAALQPMIMRHAMNAGGTPVSQQLTAEQNATLAEILAPTGIPTQALDQFKPWFLALTVTTVVAQRMGLGPEQGVDMALKRAAGERGMEIGELESAEWQIGLFASMAEEQQLSYLRKTLDEADKIEETLRPMLAAWSSGDADGLVAIMNQSSSEDPALHRLIFTDRNATWADWIVNRLEQPGTVFVAVGAGHLAGEDSVQTMLGARGVEVERVQ